MKELNRQLKDKDYKRVYLLYGDEKYLKKVYETKMTESIIDENMKMMNLNIFEENGADIRKITDASETLPFMSEYRLVIVKDSDLFAQGKKEDSEKMLEYMDNIPDSSILLFVESKVDKRSGLYKKVSKIGYALECKSMKENELAEWAVKIADGRMETSTATYLIRTVESSMENLQGEINKLMSYVPEGREITKKAIDDICTKSLETRVFDLIDALAGKNTNTALKIYNNLLTMKESPLMVLTMMARQFRLILQCKYLMQRGLGSKEISEEIKTNEYVVKKCMGQSKNFKNKDLLGAINDCLRCDVDIKNGRIGDKLGVEMILLKYGGGR